MKTYSLKNTIFDVLTFVVVYFTIQLVCQMAGACLALVIGHESSFTFLAIAQKAMEGNVMAATTIASSILTLLLYTRAKWTPVSRTYLKTRPWAVVVWTMLLALGTILPLEWLYEQLQLDLPKSYEELFRALMRDPLGYVALGLLVPLAEELVFRGGVLRVLLSYLGDRRHWIAIAISAIIFAVVHGNVAQGTHALIMGLLLGWLYYRTRSIVPGVVLHWTNNTVAYALMTLFPQLGDGKLIDFFHGSERALYMGLVFSLCIFIPSLYQLILRLKRAK